VDSISEDPHWTIDNMVFGDIITVRNGVLAPSSQAIMQAGNLYVFCINNPVMWVDPSGKSILLAIGGAISAAKTFGPPLVAAIGATVIYNQARTSTSSDSSVMSGSISDPTRNITITNPTTHSIGSGSAVAGGGRTGTGTISGPTVVTAHVVAAVLARAHLDEFVEAKRAQGQTVIYRTGSGNATNMTLRPLPEDPSGALSFYLKPLQGRFSITTKEIVNATGVFRAVRDGVNHVSVFPLDPTQTQGWRDSRDTALINPHPLTLVMMSITIRVR